MPVPGPPRLTHALVPADLEPRRVVPDVNVLLDVPRLSGAPFSWAAFDAVTTAVRSNRLPARGALEVDGLRTVAIIRSGLFTRLHTSTGRTYEIRMALYTSDHILDTAFTKLTQSPNARDPRDRGLGWTDADANDYLNAIEDVVGSSGGHVVPGPAYAQHAPPLDHEDGLVMASALACDAHYLVTHDRSFIGEHAKYRGQVIVHPSQFVRLVQQQRRNGGVNPAIGL